MCVLPYAGKPSVDLRARLRCTIEKYIPISKFSVVLRSICRLGNLFRFKDFLEKKVLHGVVYYYTRGNGKVTYYGKAFDHFFRASEHMRISNLKGKRIKNVKELAISGHLLQCDTPINFDDFDILASDSHNLLLFFSFQLLISFLKTIFLYDN